MDKNKLTKAEIIDNVKKKLERAGYYDIPAGLLLKVIDCTFESIKEALIQQRTTELRGFGTFEVRVRKGREKAHNPKTGEIVSVEDHKVAIFRPGIELKKELWDS